MSDRRVYVGKLPLALERDDAVVEALSLCGDVETWTRARDPRTDAPKRFGFATFRDVRGAVTRARAGRARGGGGGRAVCHPNAAAPRAIGGDAREDARGGGSRGGGERGDGGETRDGEGVSKSVVGWVGIGGG